MAHPFRPPLPTAALVATAALASLAVTGCSGSGQGGSRKISAAPAATVLPNRTITASGDGRAEGSPDLLTVSLGVQTHDPRAQAALATNGAKAQALIARLKADGVVAKDIQTSQLQVNPDYAQPSPSVPPRITGYSVTDLVTAKLRKLDGAGVLIDDAVASAGNDARVDSIAYSIDDDSALLAAARADAVRQAQARAKAMADAAGVGLGAVRTITDVTQPAVMPAYLMGPQPAASGAAGASAPATPLQPGSERLTVQVVVVFDIA